MSVVLNKILEPLSKHYNDPNVIEIRMGKPGVVVRDIRGKGRERVLDPDLSLHVLELICQSLSNYNGLQFDADESPIISTTLPGNHRFECMLGPTPANGISLAIRCKHAFDVSWEAFGVEGDLLAYFEELTTSEQNIIISGATNTGKTTFMNKMLRIIDEDVRVVTVEDTPELEVERFWDGQSLLASRNDIAANGMMDWLKTLDHTLRITPTRLILGEISILNAIAALNILNTGNKGFMCSIHAESPEMVINRKFDQNTSMAGHNVQKIPEYLADMVDCVIQIKRDDATGKRTITDIMEPKKGSFLMKNGVML